MMASVKTRRALFIFPSYYVDGLGFLLRHTLEECGTLPRDLKGYRCGGSMKDHDVFVNKVLGSGMEIKVLEGTVCRRTVMDQLAWLLEPSVDVALLLFCGHGMNEGSPRHGTLVCSYKHLVSAEAIDAVVAAQRFCGTLIRVLNMCEENAIAPGPGLPFQHGRSLLDASRADHDEQFHLVAHKDVMLLATGTFEETAGGKAGTHFIAALGRMFDAESILTYERLDELLQRHWPGGSGRALLYPARLKGIFGWPANGSQVSGDSA